MGTRLFVTYSGLLGGAERFLVEIASGLEPRPLVACPPGPLADAARERGLQVIELPERPLELKGAAPSAARHLAGHARDIRKLVRNLEPALVCAWGMRSALAMGGERFGPRPQTFQVARHHDFSPGGPVGRAVRAAMRRADLVIVNSQAVRDDLGLDAEVIWPGVDLERFRPAAGQPEGPPRALWLGALVPWKRPDLAKEIAERVEGLDLQMAGAPLGEDPALADPVQALQGAHLLLHTADREPFGIVVAEALACGTPVVAPAAGGPAEVVDDSCGRLFPPGDAGAAAAAVSEVLREREGLSHGARRRAEAKLDLAEVRRRFGELLAVGATAGPAGQKLSLVAVTHNSRPELEALLASVTRHLPDAEVVVADSGSTDGSAEAARAWPGGATVIELENVGYGQAANAGVSAASRPVTVVMNADVELLDSSLALLADELLQAGSPDRLLAPSLLLPDGSRQDNAQHEPGAAPLALYALVPRSIEPWRSRRPRRVGWAVGACVAGRTETLLRLGPFDPEIFLYAEDLDLGLRAADAGVETWFQPAARVLHRRAHSTQRAFDGEPYELLAGRRRAVVEARRGRSRTRIDDALQTVTFANRLALKTLARRDTGREREQLRALRAARRGE